VADLQLILDLILIAVFKELPLRQRGNFNFLGFVFVYSPTEKKMNAFYAYATKCDTGTPPVAL
jgi:hypothetical protein